MPTLPQSAAANVDDDAIRVLITGFGPFAGYEVNPSWVAVSRLRNTILERAASPVTHRAQEVLAPGGPRPRPIHITVHQVPVTYAAVLSTVPGMHARPPVLPDADDAFSARPPPPRGGYDLVLHVGVAGPGPLRVEALGHKLHYNIPDVDGKLAPIVVGAGGSVPNGHRVSDAERRERDRLAPAPGDRKGTVRGFGKGYETFADELLTDLDTEALVDFLHSVGAEQVVTSSDAGRYLCDFIYYCSLAEAERCAQAGGQSSKVLFLHCPPLDQPLSPDAVADAIKLIVGWVFWE